MTNTSCEGKTEPSGGVLILSCNTGGGHNSCAYAVKEAYARICENCVIKDALSFVSADFSSFICGGHVRIYRYLPRLFKNGYAFFEKHRGVMKKEGVISSVLSRGSDSLAAFVQSGGFHTVICTHVFAADMLSSAVKKHSLNCKTAFISTDYTCCPGTEFCGTDVVFLPAGDVTVPDCVSRTVVSGIPVRSAFYRQSQIKPVSSLGKIHAVIINGSMGCGNMKKLVDGLSKLKSDFCLSVVCGTNKKLKKHLENRFKACENIRVYGYVDDMSALMDTADILITKPGGITTTEACVKKLPMLFIDSVGGLETYNLDYFVSRDAAVNADDIDEAVRIFDMICSVPEMLEDMKQNMPDMSVPAVETIIKTMSVPKGANLCV